MKPSSRVFLRRFVFFCALTLALFSAGPSPAFEVPTYAGPVTDRAGVLSSDQIERLGRKIQDYRQASSNEIGVLIVKSLDGQSIDNLAYDVFKKWGIGRQAKDNGVLFIVAVEDRKARVEVGYGLEGELTDAESGRLVRRDSPMAGHFRRGDYFGGVNAVIDGIIAAIGGEYNPPSATDDEGRRKKGTPIPLLFFILFPLLGIIMRIMRRNAFRDGSGGWWTGGGMGGFGGAGGFSSGGGGGGGFSFGGGSSGGGGASGGW
ncbi:MAG: TPM domain-containing protein [candidate division Zixibacteria bacterium]|nr:TPM domain-containing protein [candidate division Zixibacteria bacterium]